MGTGTNHAAVPCVGSVSEECRGVMGIATGVPPGLAWERRKGEFEVMNRGWVSMTDGSTLLGGI